MKSVGEALIDFLVEHEVEVVFGIPGVHTVELYRGLEKSGIRHVTPRHEQGAGFMADGYARVTGKPGVAMVITGPGMTNILTPMAQARADSIPMLVISSANPVATTGRGLGYLHELPDQHGLVKTVADLSLQIERSEDMACAIEQVFASFTNDRPMPAHIQIPTDVAKLEAVSSETSSPVRENPKPEQSVISRAVDILGGASSPVILAGGGMRIFDDVLTKLAEKLDAPTVLTTNARGLMHKHPLGVPVCPDLDAARRLIGSADAVLALGTELGQTDYDVFGKGSIAEMNNLIRVDISQTQLDSHKASVKIKSDAGEFAKTLIDALPEQENADHNGAPRAATTRAEAWNEIGDDYRSICDVLNVMRDTVPNSIMVGDSTQPIYAGNYCYDHDRPGGWFNAATGYGALGFGIPAAIGASIGARDSRVICICGDGGAQFSYPELMAAADEDTPVIFVIWNNKGYKEIEISMENADVNVVGCDPSPPNFSLVANSCGMPYYSSDLQPENVAASLKKAVAENKPVLVELIA